MEEAMQKFSKYSISVEHDLESLIFSMLNLIDTKTKTLKKLLKLHLQIRGIRKQTRTKYRKHFKSHDNIPESELILKDSVDDLTFSEDSQENNQNEMNELKCISESFAISMDSSKEHIDIDGHNDEKFDEVNEFVNNVEKSDNENVPDIDNGDRDLSLKELSKKSYNISEASKTKVHLAKNYEVTDCTTSMHSLNMKNPSRTNSTKSIQSEAIDTKSVKTVVYPNFCAKNENQAIKNNTCIHSSISTTSSYCVVSHIQGVLNTLQDCLPGDSGVYIENSSYKDVLNTLERLLMSCGITYQAQEEPNRAKAIGMNKCSTQPTLKTTYEEVPKRMISSSTECNKTFKKKIKTVFENDPDDDDDDDNDYDSEVGNDDDHYGNDNNTESGEDDEGDNGSN